MTAHAYIGLHGVRLAAPPSLRLVQAIAPARPAPQDDTPPPAPDAPAKDRHRAAPEQMKPQTRATLAALAQAPGPTATFRATRSPTRPRASPCATCAAPSTPPPRWPSPSR